LLLWTKTKIPDNGQSGPPIERKNAPAHISARNSLFLISKRQSKHLDHFGCCEHGRWTNYNEDVDETIWCLSTESNDSGRRPCCEPRQTISNRRMQHEPSSEQAASQRRNALIVFA